MDLLSYMLMAVLGAVLASFLALIPALHIYNFLKHGHVSLRPPRGHFGIIGTSKAYSYYTFIILISPYTFAPEIMQYIGMFGIVPASQCTLIPAVPFLLCPKHRLLV